MSIKIREYTIAQMLDALRQGEWQVPKFQREFVWDTSAIASLATSIIDAYPIGMVTLWEQSDANPLDLERLSIPDYDPSSRQRVVRHFGNEGSGQNLLAILDGRQRCTAVAMAFAGFMPTFTSNKYCGRYFLNAAEADPLERVVFISRLQLQKRGLISEAAMIGAGLFPLASDKKDESVLRQWYRYAQEIQNPSNYPNSELPDEEELARRDAIVQSAFDGINDTRLAACVVPAKYDLGQICEIFETLNLTGMKVSTVDLINSWIYRETRDISPNNAVEIREWIRELGELDGAVGWANAEKRPELIAQMVTACFVALDDSPDKPRPRQVSGSRKVTRITSVKSPDLLATPAEHWLKIRAKQDDFAGFIDDFQTCVAGGSFAYDKCPYPISASIYIALRWHKQFDPLTSHSMWEVDDLESLYKGFFWRNALATRYDQGFLTRLGTDLLFLKALLRRRGEYDSKSEWLKHCDEKLSTIIDPESILSKDGLQKLTTDGRPGGAIQSAILLPMIATVQRDIDGVEISPGSESQLELHHIFPSAWCKNNASGKLADLLDKDKSGRDLVNSIANTMPLARITNNKWKAKIPQAYIEERHIDYASSKTFFSSVFIGKEEFRQLTDSSNGIRAFWENRSEKLAEHLLALTHLEV
jgi:hypothetical protein